MRQVQSRADSRGDRRVQAGCQEADASRNFLKFRLRELLAGPVDSSPRSADPQYLAHLWGGIYLRRSSELLSQTPDSPSSDPANDLVRRSSQTQRARQIMLARKLRIALATHPCRLHRLRHCGLKRVHATEEFVYPRV